MNRDKLFNVGTSFVALGAVSEIVIITAAAIAFGTGLVEPNDYYVHRVIGAMVFCAITMAVGLAAVILAGD